MHRSVHRRSGARKHSHDAERVVVVVFKAGVANAVGNHDGVAHPIAKRGGHIRAQHGVLGGGEHLPARELQGTPASETVVGEVIGVGAEHAEAPVRIAQRQRNSPCHFRLVRDRPIAFPTNVVGGVADAKDGVQQEIRRPASGADDQIRAGDGAGEVRLRLDANLLHAGQQRHAHGHREHGQPSRQPPMQQALERQSENQSANGLGVAAARRISHCSFRSSRAPRPKTGDGRTAARARGRG